MSKSGILKSSIAKKVAMSLSAFFLISFLLIHVAVNALSLCSPDAYNVASHFMGTNPVIQFAMQPILIFGVVFHFVLGFVLELKNRKAQGIKYVKNNGAANSTWMSRNMAISGAVILLFMIGHFIDFWIPELNYKYIQHLPEDPTRYYHELVLKFQDPVKVGIYVLAFIFLALHLLHGFNSAFQSIGLNNKYTRGFRKFAFAFSILVPLTFIFIAVFHHFNH